jgi:hypothetical protein
MKRLATVCALLATSALFASASVRSDEDDLQRLTVHEWGTFTAIAGEDGQPVRWLPLGGPNDLPCFVERAPSVPEKSTLWATVRMETPVVYFYAPGEMKVDVEIRFPLGLMTEHYPAARVRGGSIGWTGVRVAPGAAAGFPVEPGPSHYYATRATDAAPLRVGSQTERFLFYRGVGSFPLPVSATVDANENVTVANLTRQPIGQVVIFENRRGTLAYRHVDLGVGAETVARPSPGATLSALTAELERMLMGRGLFPKEAAAMVATWSDSWFEEGTRLFYVLTQDAVDTILPLRVTPRPAHTVRVFVGRLEVITPSLLQDVESAVRANDRHALARHARFLHPIADRIAAHSLSADRNVIQERIRTTASSFSAVADSSACSR